MLITALVVLSFGAAAFTALTPDDVVEGVRVPVRGDRDGSVVLGSHSLGPPLAVPVTYDLTYQLVKPSGTSWQERHLVRRPFDARVTVSVGGRVNAERITTLGRLATRTNEQWIRITTPIAPSGSDLRPDASFPEALRDGLVERREVRRVAGRDCQVYRIGSEITTGRITPVRASSQEFADVCVDRQGLVLEEVWVDDGRPIRWRIAVDVAVDVAIEDGAFALPAGTTDLGLDSGDGSIRRLVGESRAPFDVFFDLDELPSGFGFFGRFAIIPPDLSERSPTESRRASSASVTSVWTRGPDVLLVDQGAWSGIGNPPFSPDPAGRTIQVEGVGPVEAVLDARINEVRTTFPDGRYLRVAGTLRVAELRAVMASLRPGPGGELQFAPQQEVLP